MIIGYVRVSSEQQDMKSQRQAILEYADRTKLNIAGFVDGESLDSKVRKGSGIRQSTGRLRKGDTLIVAQLSHLGRSLTSIISAVNHVANRGIRLIAVKEDLDIKASDDDDSRIIRETLSLAVELLRELISDRTRKALAVRRNQGAILGRPKGRLGKSKLDSRTSEIIDLLKDKASYSFMARRFKVSLPTMIAFIKKRKLEEPAEEAPRA
jgi:DNA invertase Pin-like site-specific DNA recombinase